MALRESERQRQLAQSQRWAAEENLAWGLWRAYWPEHFEITNVEGCWIGGSLHPEFLPWIEARGGSVWEYDFRFYVGFPDGYPQADFEFRMRWGRPKVVRGKRSR